MLIEERPVIVELSKRHDRESFSCGVAVLDRYIRELAPQDVRRSVTRVFVAQGFNPDTIEGFYTLSAASIAFSSMPGPTRRKLPRYPIPAARIGRLAVDLRYQRKGLGCYLLMDAIDRVLRASELIGVFAVVVDAKDAQAGEFYKKYGFIPLLDDALKLFSPLATLQRLE